MDFKSEDWILKKNLLTFFTTLVLFVGLIPFFKGNAKALILTETADVNVSATIPACLLQIKVYPEKRIPPAGNWWTHLTVEIYDSGFNYEGTVTATSGLDGVATFDLCANAIYLFGDTYDFYIRGYSHLRRLYPGHPAFSLQSTVLDLSGDGLLYAGETSVVFDNYINALDISTQVANIYTGNVKNDLNQDGLVNILDISNTITNYLMTGD